MSVKVETASPGHRRSATIANIASQCGVSLQTVSNVLNGRVGQASDHTRRRVMDAARDLNYFPSAVARGLARRRMNTLGIAFYPVKGNVVSHEYSGPVLEGILEVMSEIKQDAVLFTGHMHEDVESNLSAYCDGRCDGVLLVSTPNASATAARLLQVEMPFVMIGMEDEAGRAPWVGIDNSAAAATMVNHLIACGHRRIAFLGGSRSVFGSRPRYDGYCAALRSANIDIDERLVLPGEFTIESGFERVRSLCTQADVAMPTAIFCSSDAIAIGALDALKASGLRVPEDVSVAGFDDAAPAAMTDPPLTTMSQPVRDMGRHSVRLLLDQINRQTSSSFVRLPAELVCRESVAAPRTD